MEDDKQANQDKKDGTHVSNEPKEQPTNLLERFSLEKNPTDTQNSNPEPPQEPELNLNLSLGSIPNENTLTRSSSIAGVMNFRKDSWEPERGFLSLERSSSLPTDAEQLHRMTEWRELQTMRKGEAKKWLVEDKEKEKASEPPKVANGSLASPSRATLPNPTIVKAKEEPVTQIITGLKGSAAANIASSSKSPSEPSNVGALVLSRTNSNGKLVKPVETEPASTPFKRPRISYANFQNNGMEVMRQMPSVSATGDGPNGKKVEGFLYRYMKGHVSIMCLCHGSFLSPAEFVKHAGGRDVPNPMKHITVYSTFSV